MVVMLICLIALPAWGGHMIMRNRITSSGDDYSDITFWCGFEGTWSSPTYTMGDDDYSAGDTTGTANSDAVVNTDAALVGTYGLDSPSGYDKITFDVSSNDIVSGTSGRVGCKIRINTWEAVVYFIMAKDATNNRNFFVETYGTDELLFAWDGSGVATTTDANLSTGTIYFIEISYDTTADEYELFVDGVSKATGSLARDAFSPEYFYTGNNSGTNGDIHVDNYMVSNDKDRDLNALKNLTSSPR